VNLVKYFFKDPLSLQNVRLMEMWTVIEATSALFAVSLPAFKQFILRTIRTRAGDKVRPMRRLEDQQMSGGVEGLEYSGATNFTSGPELGQQQGDTSGVRKARGIRGMVSRWLGGGKKGSSRSRSKGKNSLPSFVRGSLVGSTGWVSPKVGFGVESGGTGESSRNRRRRTLDDLELSSFDDYEEHREPQVDGSKTMRGAIEGASAGALAVEGPSGGGEGDESLSARGADV